MADQSADALENDLNRCLFLAINRVSYYAMQTGEDIPPVVYEGRNPPAPTDNERVAREFKIPDFYWAYIDPLTDSPDDSYKQFVVECKRLTPHKTNYSQEYVLSGIARFISESHAYGKGMPGGAMVGYLQYLSIDSALAEVNGVAGANAIPPLALRQRNGEISAELNHQLLRSFPISPFLLVHVWARIDPNQIP